MQFIETKLNQLFKNEYIIHGLFFIGIITFFIIKSNFHGDVLAGAKEEYLKLKFATRMNGFGFFMPWAGNGGDFYGHPGLMNLLYYLWSEVFGNTISSARHFVLASSCLTVVAIYTLVGRTYGIFVGFFTALSFFLLPLFQIESIIFMQLLGSFAPALFALYFYQRGNLFFYSVLATAGFLWLESAIAIPMAVLFYEIKGNFRNGRKFTGRLLTLLVPFLCAILFFIVRSQSEQIQKHVTQDLVIRRLLNPILIITENDWQELVNNRWATFTENLPFGFMVIFLLITGWSLFFRKIPRLGLTGKILGVAFLLQLTFYSLYSEHPGGGDFYLGFIFCFMVFFLMMSVVKHGKALSLGVIFLLAVNTWFQLKLPGYGMSPVTIDEYTRHEEYSRMKKKIEAIQGGPMRCFQFEFVYHNIFCHPFFNLVPENIQSVTKMDASNIVIIDNKDPTAWDQLYSHKMAPTGRSVHLGGIRGSDLSILWIKSFAD